jgi:hypothetical protein
MPCSSFPSVESMPEIEDTRTNHDRVVVSRPNTMGSQPSPTNPHSITLWSALAENMKVWSDHHDNLDHSIFPGIPTPVVSISDLLEEAFQILDETDQYIGSSFQRRIVL